MPLFDSKEEENAILAMCSRMTAVLMKVHKITPNEARKRSERALTAVFGLPQGFWDLETPERICESLNHADNPDSIGLVLRSGGIFNDSSYERWYSAHGYFIRKVKHDGINEFHWEIDKGHK